MTSSRVRGSRTCPEEGSMRSPVSPRGAAAAFAACALLGALAAGQASAAGTVALSTADSSVQADNTIGAIVRSGDRVYVGGNFSRFGAPTTFGADLATADGARNTASAQPNNSVYTSVGDGAGGWYVGGNFTTVGSTARN